MIMEPCAPQLDGPGQIIFEFIKLFSPYSVVSTPSDGSVVTGGDKGNALI